MKQTVKEEQEAGMFRIWAREFKNNKMLRDLVVPVPGEDTRTHKVFEALHVICDEFDLGSPIWLDANVDEFRRQAKTRFYSDSFIEQIAFDYLEIWIIEED